MDGLPPPGTPTPAPIPPPPPATAEQVKTANRKARVWVIIAGVVVALMVIGSFIPDEEDEPDPPTRAELAEQTWDRMSLSDQAAICDGYNQFGESFTVDNLLDGTDGDERMARALLNVVKDEC